MVEKTIKIKKRGGGTRLQRVKVLASGKFKFIKNKKSKQRARAVKRIFKKFKRVKRSNQAKIAKRRRKSQPIRTRKRSRNTVARKRRSIRSRATGGFRKITGNKFVRGAVLGLGGGALAIQVTERFAPQFSGIAGPVGAFVMGGPIGLVASLFLQGGLGNLFGGSTAGNGGGQTV